MSAPWPALPEGNLSRGLLGLMEMEGEVYLRLAVCRVGLPFFSVLRSKMEVRFIIPYHFSIKPGWISDLSMAF